MIDGQRSFHGLVFPNELEPFQIVEDGIEDFESRQAGLGYSASYEIDGLSVASVTAYIYDMGLGMIPDDIVSDPVQSEFKRSVYEILNSSAYGSADVTENGIYTIAKCLDMWVAFLDLKPAGQQRMLKSLLALAPWRGKFVKLRVSQPDMPALNDHIMMPLAAWARYLAGAGRPSSR